MELTYFVAQIEKKSLKHNSHKDIVCFHFYSDVSHPLKTIDATKGLN